MEADIDLPIHVDELYGVPRTAEPITLGVPLSRGHVSSVADLVVTAGETVVPHHFRVLARWPDGSAKWLLVYALAQVGARQRATLFVRRRSSAPPAPAASAIGVTHGEQGLVIDTEAAKFTLRAGRGALLREVFDANGALLDGSGCRLQLTDTSGRTADLELGEPSIEDHGAVRVTVSAEGRFRGDRFVAPLFVKVRASFTLRSADARMEVLVRNPQPALHAGGLWDLGDPGSYLFADLSMVLRPRSAGSIRWRVAPQEDVAADVEQDLIIYQDSSGGRNWSSPNHVDASGELAVRFRGYEVRAGESAAVVARGERAEPALEVASAAGCVAAGVLDFWQNFPKALRWRHGELSLGLFPNEAGRPFELQGGEQKRHVIVLGFTTPRETALRALQQPVAAHCDPSWVESTGAINAFVTEANDPNADYIAYVRQIIDGPRSFFERREIIDEYGWRNYGDLYADHEAVRHAGSAPFVSHYNNQYDFMLGAFLHFHRTGEQRWQRLMTDVARHTIDIDIYRTEGDIAAFNHGYFWHTDHYKPAATATHRTYSKRNGGRGYGGGPSGEHNYTSGLLHYYYWSGDPEAADTVLKLAGWVCAMDEGARNVFSIVDEGPTGLASATRDSLFHKAGRGAGNSINALLDAYQLSGARAYLDKAEELIKRCIHPADDIDALRLDDPENRWSYLVFLQVLGKYLDLKLEFGETDYGFWYARDSLLHYGNWIAENEVPYKDVLHKVEIPTETWPAHDVRKTHVLHYAAKYGDVDRRSYYSERAEYFFRRCLADVMSFETAALARPLVILCVFGGLHAYYMLQRPVAGLPAKPGYYFGHPQEFVPQRARLIATIKRKFRLLAAELRRHASRSLLALRRR